MGNYKKSVVDLIKQPTTKFMADTAELSIDEIIEHIDQDADILKNIPIVKWIFLGHTIASNVHLSFFLKKYALFIGPIKKEIPENFWDEVEINELVDNKKKFNTLIEETLFALDRYQAVNKAKILGVLFVKTFKEKIFTVDEYNTLIFSIELMHPHLGVQCLKEFYDYKIRLEATTDEKEKGNIWSEGSKLDFSPLASTCLVKLPQGGSYMGDYGGGYLNDLGHKFHEEVVSII